MTPNETPESQNAERVEEAGAFVGCSGGLCGGGLLPPVVDVASEGDLVGFGIEV